MKNIASAFALALALSGTAAALAAEPDGLTLPPGFHASVVADGVGAARHIAIRANGDIYISTAHPRTGSSVGVIALHLDKSHKADQIEHFGTVDGGTGIRIYKDALYAASPTTLYRFTFSGDALIPAGDPQIVLDGIPGDGFPSRGLAFDNDGHFFVEVGAMSNICTDDSVPKGAKPVGLRPCPSLAVHSGVWRFDAGKLGQKFPDDGEQYATGVRDMMAMNWSAQMGGVYSIMQDRNGTAAAFGDVVSASDDADNIAEEMHKIVKGANLGWPYTYYDLAQHVRVLAPEYGGDGKKPDAAGSYSTPVTAFPAHSSPLDLVFYDAKKFPAAWRGGAFVIFHGGSEGGELPAGHHGYDIVFVPFDKSGKPGASSVFADGFAGPAPEDKNPGAAKYRPTGAAVGPDGALYVVDGNKGRLWRISYGAD